MAVKSIIIESYGASDDEEKAHDGPFALFHFDFPFALKEMISSPSLLFCRVRRIVCSFLISALRRAVERTFTTSCWINRFKGRAPNKGL